MLKQANDCLIVRIFFNEPQSLWFKKFENLTVNCTMPLKLDLSIKGMRVYVGLVKFSKFNLYWGQNVLPIKKTMICMI